MKRERRFIADASHELRSPIARIRGALETGDHTLGGLERSHEVALSAVKHLDFMAEGLLELDSIRGPEDENPSRPVDIDELVLLQVDALRKSTSLDIDASCVSGGQVLAREVDMMRVVENLSSNAVRHAESRITYSLSEHGDHVFLVVTDDGPGIPESLRTMVFERFSRIDSAAKPEQWRHRSRLGDCVPGRESVRRAGVGGSSRLSRRSICRPLTGDYQNRSLIRPCSSGSGCDRGSDSIQRLAPWDSIDYLTKTGWIG